jgi:hypothetical protein
MILLMYTATYVPYDTSFVDNDPTGVYDWELLVDSLFIFDLFLNFITAYEDLNTGIIEVRLKRISSDYIKSWFFLDLICSIPF